jgi:hypothetical protein
MTGLPRNAIFLTCSGGLLRQLQAPDGIVTTIRFRDPAARLPYQLAGAYPVRQRTSP